MTSQRRQNEGTMMILNRVSSLMVCIIMHNDMNADTRGLIDVVEGTLISEHVHDLSDDTWRYSCRPLPFGMRAFITTGLRW